MNHLSPEQLQDYVDRTLDASRRNDIEGHLRSCPACRREVASFNVMDETLRQLPPKRVSSDFTQRVMRKIGIGDVPTFGWILLRNLAPLFALTVIGSLIVLALQVTGVIDVSGGNQGGTATQSVYTSVQTVVQTGLTAVDTFVVKYLPFAFAKTTYDTLALLVGFFGIVALFDRYVLAPLMRRSPRP